MHQPIHVQRTIRMQTTTESNNATSNTHGGVGYKYQTSNDDVHFIKHDVLYKQILKNGEVMYKARCGQVWLMGCGFLDTKLGVVKSFEFEVAH